MDAIQKKDISTIETIKYTIDNFLFHCRFEKNLTQKTIEAYSIDLKQFAFYLRSSNVSSLNGISKEILKEYFQTISAFKPKTIKRKIASIKAMFNYIEYEDDTFVNPFRKIKFRFKDAHTLPSVMTIHETKKILNILYEEKKKDPQSSEFRIKSQMRNIAIVEMLFATGIRVSELCELKPLNVDLRNGLIKVLGKGNKERIIQICNQETKAVLKEYHTLHASEINEVDNFFVNETGNPLSTQSVRLMLHKYVRKAGIKKTITPHTFRHTFATLLLEENVDIRYIQNLLGHSSITTTQIYTHINSEQQRKILSAKHPRRKLSFV